MPLSVTLASSLLDLEIDQHRHITESGGRTFTTGVAALDKDLPRSLWRGGDVVAIGTDGVGIKPGSLPLELIVTHLLEQPTDAELNTDTNPTPSTPTVPPSIFIVAPPYQATATIQRLYTMLKTRLQQPSKSRISNITTDIDSTIKSHLSHVSLLQYLDISGLAESISEVLLAVTESQSESKSRGSQRSVLLVQGLSSTVTTTHRRAGTLQTAAMLSSIMQGLRNIARTSLRGGGACLVVMEVDVVWDGGAGGGQNTATAAGASGAGTGNVVNAAVSSGLKSAFSSRTGKILRINIGAVYARIVEEGVDVFVAVHDGGGRVGKGETQRVVECVRDERGFNDLSGVGEVTNITSEGDENNGNEEINSFGSWAVWV